LIVDSLLIVDCWNSRLRAIPVAANQPSAIVNQQRFDKSKIKNQQFHFPVYITRQIFPFWLSLM
jgi:hypothetical protein